MSHGECLSQLALDIGCVALYAEPSCSVAMYAEPSCSVALYAEPFSLQHW